MKKGYNTYATILRAKEVLMQMVLILLHKIFI